MSKTAATALHAAILAGGLYALAQVVPVAAALAGLLADDLEQTMRDQ
jgi:hypothetical protein